MGTENRGEISENSLFCEIADLAYPRSHGVLRKPLVAFVVDTLGAQAKFMKKNYRIPGIKWYHFVACLALNWNPKIRGGLMFLGGDILGPVSNVGRSKFQILFLQITKFLVTTDTSTMRRGCRCAPGRPQRSKRPEYVAIMK